jgi:DNA polymerase-4
MPTSESKIMLLDMDAFFAAVEQHSEPELRGKAIAVIGRAARTVVTTASYEARAFGVKTGMNRYEALKVCPRLIFVPGNNRKYTEASKRILTIIEDFSPMVEPYSIDEAFLDITGVNIFGTPKELAMKLKERVFNETGLTCSIGIAPNKLMAKLAVGMNKPDGLKIIEPHEVEGVLENLPVGELWGIGPSLSKSLESMDIRTCGELRLIPRSTLRRRFGIRGETLCLMARGIDLSPVMNATEDEDTKSIGHSTTLDKDLTGAPALKPELLRLTEMVCRRARTHELLGGKVTLTIRYNDFHTFTRQRTLPTATNSTRQVYAMTLKILASIELRSPVRLIGISLGNIMPKPTQGTLFDMDGLLNQAQGRHAKEPVEAMDAVNDRFGESTIILGATASGRAALSKAEMNKAVSGATQPASHKDTTDKKIPRKDSGIISPSWRPRGVKHVDVE